MGKSSINLIKNGELTLPTWEEFKISNIGEDYNFSNNGINYVLRKDICTSMMASAYYRSDIVILILDETNKKRVFDKGFTKENYIKACEKCKELLLEE